jgi:CelD/BcsL family acetyltransferase involved in cellulose biosynthesis
VTSVRWVETGSLSEQDVRRWTELGRSAATPNPFYEPDFVLPALEHFGEPQLDLLVAMDGAGNWIGLIPVQRRRRWRHLVGTALTGWTHPHCFLESPLISPGHEDAVMEALLDQIRRQVGLVAFDRFPAEGPMASALDSACERLGVKPIVWQSFERAALRRRADDDYVRSTLGAKHHRELRRKGRKLGRELGTDVAFVDRAGDPHAVDAFLALEAAGWKGDEGTALESGPGAQFFRALCQRFSEAGRLQMLAMQAGDRTVAMSCFLIAGEGLFCFKIAYDEALAKFSPGTQLMAETASEFHRRQELQWVDSCSKPNSETERLWPDRRRLVTMLVPGAGAKGGAVSIEARVAAALRSVLRSNGQVQRPSAASQPEQPVGGGS